MRLQRSLQAIETLNKFLVSQCRIATSKLLLAGKVDRGKEWDHRAFQRIRNMLNNILVVRMQHPTGKVVHIFLQTLTVLLNGIGIVPAVSPTL